MEHVSKSIDRWSSSEKKVFRMGLHTPSNVPQLSMRSLGRNLITTGELSDRRRPSHT